MKTQKIAKQPISDQEAWDKFVGGISPDEFIADWITNCDPTTDALNDFFEHWYEHELDGEKFTEPAPPWLRRSLSNHILLYIDRD